MSAVQPPFRHHCRCDCRLCRLWNCGAFGVQPDGSPPLLVVIEKRQPRQLTPDRAHHARARARVRRMAQGSKP
jgi:hypothetical protein